MMKNNISKDFLNAWIQFIKSTNDIAYHIVLTFKYNIKETEGQAAVSFLLHILNAKFFGKNYKKTGDYIKGFIFKEKQSRQALHYHLLVRHDEQFELTGKPTLKKHLIKSIEKIKKINRQTGKPTYQIMDRSGTYITRTYSDDVVNYVLKTMRRNNDDFIGFLTPGGVEMTS